MKTILLACLLVSLTVSLPFCSGCAGTTPAKAAVNVSDTAKITVESALRAWNNYIPVGHPSLQKQKQVRDAYRKYKAAQLAVLDAAILVKTSGDDESAAKLNDAIVAASAALADVVALIREFGVKI